MNNDSEGCQVLVVSFWEWTDMTEVESEPKKRHMAKHIQGTQKEQLVQAVITAMGIAPCEFVTPSQHL